MPHNIIEPLADACQLHGIKYRNKGRGKVSIAGLVCNSSANRREFAIISRNIEGILSTNHWPTPGYQTNSSEGVTSISRQFADNKPSNQANSFLRDGREGPSRDHHATLGLKVRML